MRIVFGTMAALLALPAHGGTMFSERVEGTGWTVEMLAEDKKKPSACVAAGKYGDDATGSVVVRYVRFLNLDKLVVAIPTDQMILHEGAQVQGFAKVDAEPYVKAHVEVDALLTFWHLPLSYARSIAEGRTVEFKAHDRYFRLALTGTRKMIAKLQECVEAMQILNDLTIPLPPKSAPPANVPELPNLPRVDA